MKIEDVRNAPEGTEITVDAATREVLSVAFPDPKRPPVSATQDAPAGRIGWLRLVPDDAFRYLMREMEGGWSQDDVDDPDYYPAERYPDAVFTPIATLPEGHVAVDRGDLHYAVSIAEDNTEHLYARPELDRLRAALDGSQP